MREEDARDLIHAVRTESDWHRGVHVKYDLTSNYGIYASGEFDGIFAIFGPARRPPREMGRVKVWHMGGVRARWIDEADYIVRVSELVYSPVTRNGLLRAGGLVNHAAGSDANAKFVVAIVHDMPCICLRTTRIVRENEQLLVDYDPMRHITFRNIC